MNDTIQKIQKAYPQVAECVILEANRTNGLGMDALQQAIYDTAAKMKYRYEFPLKEEGHLIGRMVRCYDYR